MRIVSIHAPHEGERPQLGQFFPRLYGVSIHAPHEGERPSAARLEAPQACFNPRSPRGGATILISILSMIIVFQSTLPTRGSDFRQKHYHAGEVSFQSTLPTRGSDLAPRPAPARGAVFQSTLPTRGSDHSIGARPAQCLGFNPRSPRGGATHLSLLAAPKGGKFQSTLPTRGSDGGKVHLYAAFPRIY